MPGLLILEQRAAPLLGRERETSAGPRDGRRRIRRREEEEERKKMKKRKKK